MVNYPDRLFQHLKQICMQTNSFPNLINILEHLITIPPDETGTQLMVKIENVTK